MKSLCRYFSQLVSRLMSSLSSLKRKCGNQQKKRKHYPNSPIIQIKIKLRVESDSWDHQFRVENLAKNRILFMNLLMDRGTHQAGSQAGLGGEGRERFIVTMSHHRHGDCWLHKIQMIGKYRTQMCSSAPCMLLRPSLEKLILCRFMQNWFLYLKIGSICSKSQLILFSSWVKIRVFEP